MSYKYFWYTFHSFSASVAIKKYFQKIKKFKNPFRTSPVTEKCDWNAIDNDFSLIIETLRRTNSNWIVIQLFIVTPRMTRIVNKSDISDITGNIPKIYEKLWKMLKSIQKSNMFFTTTIYKRKWAIGRKWENSSG